MYAKFHIWPIVKLLVNFCFCVAVRLRSTTRMISPSLLEAIVTSVKNPRVKMVGLYTQLSGWNGKNNFVARNNKLALDLKLFGFVFGQMLSVLRKAICYWCAAKNN